MKLRCVKELPPEAFTVGKVYHAVNKRTGAFYVDDDVCAPVFFDYAPRDGCPFWADHFDIVRE